MSQGNMGSPAKRAQYIRRNLLGRKREVVTRVISTEEEQEDQGEVISIMKEVETDTTVARDDVADKCQTLYEAIQSVPELYKTSHRNYLDSSFSNDLPAQMAALDASQPWLLYWTANGLCVLSEGYLSNKNKRRICEKLFAISPDGGPFGGGVGQLPHLASTYASINALALCDNVENCWDMIDREAIYDWLVLLKQPNGGFKTCLGVGEVDTRGVYCALSIASLLGIITDELVDGVVDFLVNCQSYEGGFGGCPHEDEAHGGYTFCAVASLCILDAIDHIDVAGLSRWCSQRQLDPERGLCGRSNKLVDGCYSFWVGGTAAIMELYGLDYLIDKCSLKDYILYCCQNSSRPGLRDKPGTHPDLYHTNYILLGLAICENSFKYSSSANSPHGVKCTALSADTSSRLSSINPIYGLPVNNVRKFVQHFK